MHNPGRDVPVHLDTVGLKQVDREENEREKRIVESLGGAEERREKEKAGWGQVRDIQAWRSFARGCCV